MPKAAPTAQSKRGRKYGNDESGFATPVDLDDIIRRAADASSEATVSRLEKRLEQQDRRIKSLEEVASEQRRDISDVKSDVNFLTERVAALERGGCASSSQGTSVDTLPILPARPAEPNLVRLVAKAPFKLAELQLALDAEIASLKAAERFKGCYELIGPKLGGTRFRLSFRGNECFQTGAIAAETYRRERQPGREFVQLAVKRGDDVTVLVEVYADRSSWDSLASAASGEVLRRLQKIIPESMDDLQRFGNKVLVNDYDAIVEITAVRGTNTVKVTLGASPAASSWL